MSTNWKQVGKAFQEVSKDFRDLERDFKPLDHEPLETPKPAGGPVPAGRNFFVIEGDADSPTEKLSLKDEAENTTPIKKHSVPVWKKIALILAVLILALIAIYVLNGGGDVT